MRVSRPLRSAIEVRRFIPNSFIFIVKEKVGRKVLPLCLSPPLNYHQDN
jgi:hypothetical protein